MPTPHKGEKHEEWISRCMSDKEQKKTFPDQKQRYAVCESKWKHRNKSPQECAMELISKIQKLLCDLEKYDERDNNP